MSFVIDLVERGLVPDVLTRAGIRSRCGGFAKDLAVNGVDMQAFANELRTMPIAVHTDAANEQHYELPPEFFVACLGDRRKYSCCEFGADETLSQAENRSLQTVMDRAEIIDGMDVLDFGCGWGSFTSFAADNFPKANITSVSNSKPQGDFIRSLGYGNVTVQTADANDFETDQKFDRIVSIEALEHMRNYEELFARFARWLKPGGKVFIHVFVHKDTPFYYDHQDPQDWMAKYFFTGGQMPAFNLFREFDRDLQVTGQWAVSGLEYEKTSNAWLKNMDAKAAQLRPLFEETYGKDAKRWWNRWRLFYLSVAEFFGHADGKEWFVGHYLLEQNQA